MLRLLNDLFNLQLSTEKLEAYAAELGSDCPFFIRQKPAFVTGRGEVLQGIDLDLSGWWLMLIHPGIHVGTKEAYGLISPSRADVDLREIVLQAPTQWAQQLKNDFQIPVIERYPEIQKALDALNAAGAVYTAMSGSGSAVYGLFAAAPKTPSLPTHWSISTCALHG
jgi:4-diphosphocytidyl-2-C-methyl-D-erythritol kinase